MFMAFLEYYKFTISEECCKVLRHQDVMLIVHMLSQILTFCYPFNFY
jgi:hypothetical protein